MCVCVCGSITGTKLPTKAQRQQKQWESKRVRRRLGQNVYQLHLRTAATARGPGVGGGGEAAGGVAGFS